MDWIMDFFNPTAMGHINAIAHLFVIFGCVWISFIVLSTLVTRYRKKKR